MKGGRDLVLADDAASIVQAINLLLRDSIARRQYEEAAAKLAAQYDWSNIEQRFAQVLRAATHQPEQVRSTRDPLVAKQP